MRVGLPLPHVAGLHRYRDWRPEVTRVVVGEVVGVVVGGRGRALLQPGGHLVIHVFRFRVI